MTDPKLIQRIDQMCVKDGEITVSNISLDGSYTLTVPVINGGEEFNAKQIATLDMEFSYDGEEATLHNFPGKLFSGDDYAAITFFIEDFMVRAQSFFDLGKKYDFNIRAHGDSLHLCAKNTDGRWTSWLVYELQKDIVSLRGNTDNLNIWLHETRKDFTPDKCLAFVSDLNKALFLSGDDSFSVKKLIDPEDWQQIANVRDASEDIRYTGKKAVSLSEKISSASNRTQAAPSSFDAKGKEKDAAADYGR